MLKTAVLVSGGGTNLQALIDAKNAGQLPFASLSLVVSSNESAFALQRAQNANIKTAVVTRKNYKNGADFDLALIDILKENDIEFVVLAGFMCILGEGFINAFPKSIINVHPSLIPSFCGEGFYGLRVHKAALEKGVKVTGATVHFVNEIPDGGEIILQKAVEVKQGDTPEILQERVMREAEWFILAKALANISEERKA